MDTEQIILIIIAISNVLANLFKIHKHISKSSCSVSASTTITEEDSQ